MGKYKREDVLIPGIPMIPTDLPFDFKRLQFPVHLAFAMTINKSSRWKFAESTWSFPVSRMGNYTSLYQKALN
ncbi:hypothetical protein GWI33_008013 [Rhynchophorus ferrugineus]|uniref:Uncharacterized protein n=1 Tax=Rhynchophorus ferrugineus TaxID=354439 RepID=A0A834IGS3_RHYFE|nr:hypothetical protein GWI33_008013 [Rhynchophorus ferrugineus]